VDCHMKATPPPEVLSYNSGGANHTFYAELTICSECHSPFLLASDIQNGVQQLMDQVYEVLIDAYLAVLDQQIAAGNTIDFNGAVTVTDVAQVTAMVFGESRGRQAIGVTVGGVEYGPFRLTDIDVVDGSATPPTLADMTDDTTLKAGWNWNLVNNDGSTGIHNPFFANGLLIAARDALLVQLSGGRRRSAPSSIGGPQDRFELRPGSPRQRQR